MRTILRSTCLQGKLPVPNLTLRQCTLCRGEATRLALQMPNRQLAACADCGLVRTEPFPTPEELHHHYNNTGYYTTEPPSVDTGRKADLVRAWVNECFWGFPKTLPTWKRALLTPFLWPLKNRTLPAPYPKDLPVLDIGCGNGQRLLEYEAAGHRNLFGVEPTQGAAEQAAKHTQATIFPGLLEEAQLPKNHFQLVILNQVLEHVPEPSETLKLIHGLMRPGGYFYLTVPHFGSWESKLFGAAWEGLKIPEHLHHFTEPPLTRFLKEAGFEIEVQRTDSVLAITEGSLHTWVRMTNPSAKGFWLKLPRFAMAPFTLVSDWFGKGQMLRYLCRKPAG